MKPDPIPEFILLKEFKGLSPNSREYQNAYDRVCSHHFVKDIEYEQNGRGFWHPFHGYSEDRIRRCLSFGLEKDHPCLKKASDYIIKVLNHEDFWDQVEKQDNIRWWPEMFVPLVCAAMLSLIDPYNEILDLHRQRWSSFAEAAFSRGIYDKEAESKAQHDYFGFKTKRTILAYNYYVLLLLAPTGKANFISDTTDQALVDYVMNEAEGIYYVYERPLLDFIPDGMKGRKFSDWVRALSLISQFRGWQKYEESYTGWVISQMNDEGFWELAQKPRRFDFPLSDSWRTRKNRIIDSTIMALRFLSKHRAY